MVAQADGRFSVDDPPPITNTFLVRKIRPTFTGRITRFFEFKLMPDFGSRRQLYKTRMWMRDSRPRSAFGAQGQDASGSMGRRSGPRSLFDTRRRRRNFFARAGDGRGEPGTQSFTIAINWFPNGFIKYYYGTLERRIRPQRNDRAARGERLSLPDAARILNRFHPSLRYADLTCAQQM
jgi:hypothetical protein